LFEALRLQDPLQVKYTGGTVFHIFVGEKQLPEQSIKQLIKKITHNFHLPYLTLSPTFSICPSHGYIYGEHELCPICKNNNVDQKCSVFSRIVGYLRPVDQWNAGKQAEFKDRKIFDRGGLIKNNHNKNIVETTLIEKNLEVVYDKNL